MALYFNIARCGNRDCSRVFIFREEDVRCGVAFTLFKIINDFYLDNYTHSQN
jgi:hypothetical protein